MKNVLNSILVVVVGVQLAFQTVAAQCIKLEERCVLYKYDATGTKKLCIKKEETWSCSKEEKVQVGCNRWERKQTCSGFIEVPSDIYETKDYSDAFGQAIGKIAGYDQLNDIWSGWHGECEDGWFTDFSWLTDPMFLLSAATTMAGSGLLGDTVKDAYVGAKEAVSGWISGGLFGNADFALCMANAGLDPQTLLKVSMLGKQPQDGLLAQDKPTMYLTGDQLQALEKGLAGNVSYTVYATDALGGGYVSFDNASDAITTQSMVCDGTLSTGNVLDIATGLASGSVAGYLKAANSAANLINTYNQAEVIATLNPMTMFVINLAINVIMSFDDCDACRDRECAMTHDDSGLQLKTNQFMNNKMCHYIRTECSWEIDLGFTEICLRHKRHYCCYDQILTRIFVEQAKLQLGKGWASCNDITIADLERLSFRQCEPGENQYRDKCMDLREFIYVLETQLNRNVDMEDISEAAASALGGSIVTPN